MIYPDYMIEEWAKNGGIDPFNPKFINPASLDLTLSPDIIQINPAMVIDSSNYGLTNPQMVESNKMHLHKGQKFTLHPGIFVLASSNETVHLTNRLAGQVTLKSTSARTGIGHAFAGWIDPGFHGQITFELFSHVPVVLVPNMPITQLVLYQMHTTPHKAYGETGRYQNQFGPTEARAGRNLHQISDKMVEKVKNVGEDVFGGDIENMPLHPEKKGLREDEDGNFYVGGPDSTGFVHIDEELDDDDIVPNVPGGKVTYKQYKEMYKSLGEPLKKKYKSIKMEQEAGVSELTVDLEQEFSKLKQK